MLYNSNQEQDELNILEHINSYTEQIGLSTTAINTVKLRQLCLRMRDEFPCKFGIDEASIFKKAAVFVACFVEENPIDNEAFINSNLKDNIKDKNPNAIIALDIAFKFMSLAKVTRRDDTTLIIQNGIMLSMHSYCDFLDMLSQDIALQTHFMPLALLFEQVVYKTHSNMQYTDIIDFSQESEDDIHTSRYPSSLSYDEDHPEWAEENYIEFWLDIRKK